MELECFQCFVTQGYLTALAADFECPDCGRFWRIPRAPKRSQSPPKLDKIEKLDEPEAKVFMCTNSWCDYFCEENDSRTYQQVKNMLSSHKRTCDFNWKKRRVFQRRGKSGGYFVPITKKMELKRKAESEQVATPSSVKLERLDNS